MFTLKFMRQDGGLTSLSAPRYSVVKGGDRTSIWIYPTLREESPALIDLHMDEDQNTYYELFVENSSGKTVDRHRAISSPQES